MRSKLANHFLIKPVSSHASFLIFQAYIFLNISNEKLQEQVELAGVCDRKSLKYLVTKRLSWVFGI